MNKQFKRFKKFHAENPLVYSELKKLSKKVKVLKSCYSIYALMHVIRFNFDINTNGKPFKISNDNIPFYARMLVTEFPEYEGFFAIKGGIHVDSTSHAEIKDVIIETNLKKL